jgi:hypothetical protein|tara:strand:- start:316 stop:546 length:231 start_codon:yes stop_codon:yes gene_type:complete
MKNIRAFIELPICKERYLRSPSTEMIGDEIVNKWEYNSISFACQGELDTVTFRYKKSEYNYDLAIQELEKFIKRNS